MMRDSEATIQAWFEAQFHRKGILPYIVNEAAVTDALAQSAAQNAPLSLSQSVRETLLRAAQAVLDKLTSAKLVTANQNISCFPDDELKPDLVLMGRDQGSFVVIELKKSHQTSRQAITELVAYAQAIEHLYPSAHVAMVLVSPDWRPLLDYAVINQVTAGRRQILALEITSSDENQFLLQVRVDALTRNAHELVFASESLPAETVTFERRAARKRQDCPIEAINALMSVARDGDRSAGSGFALLCRSESYDGYQWHLTVMALDPFRLLMDVDDEARWNNPIAAFVRGEPRESISSADVQQSLQGDDDFIPWDSPTYPPEPGAAMALIDAIPKGQLGSVSSSHDNQKHWGYVKSAPFHSVTRYVAFEAWGLVGDLIRQNCERLERLSIGAMMPAPRRLDWSDPLNWVPCIDMVTRDSPLHDDLLTISSCHALGVVFRNWLLNDGTPNAAFRRVLDYGRIIQALRKVTAICQNSPALATEVPIVRMNGRLPVHSSVLEFLDWMSTEFFPDKWLRFAFHLGYEVPQRRLYEDDSGYYAMPEGEQDMLRQANSMLECARSRRLTLDPEMCEIPEEYDLETHLQGRALTTDDLIDFRLRRCFLVVVSPHFAQVRHENTSTQPLVDV
jgi:hypothetical protein